jgi:hypothetical protein
MPQLFCLVEFDIEKILKKAVQILPTLFIVFQPVAFLSVQPFCSSPVRRKNPGIYLAVFLVDAICFRHRYRLSLLNIGLFLIFIYCSSFSRRHRIFYLYFSNTHHETHLHLSASSHIHHFFPAGWRQ